MAVKAEEKGLDPCSKQVRFFVLHRLRGKVRHEGQCLFVLQQYVHKCIGCGYAAIDCLDFEFSRTREGHLGSRPGKRARSNSNIPLFGSLSRAREKVVGSERWESGNCPSFPGIRRFLDHPPVRAIIFRSVRRARSLQVGSGLCRSGSWFIPHCLANHTITPPQPASILKLTSTQSGKAPEMPHNRPIFFSGADYLLLTKEAPGPVCDRILYRHESPLSLPLRIGFERSTPRTTPNSHSTRTKHLRI
jgi:hypothetical protein